MVLLVRDLAKSVAYAQTILGWLYQNGFLCKPNALYADLDIVS